MKECVTFTFYIRRSHPEIVHGVEQALELYLQAVGPGALRWYPDLDGDWQELDEAGWAFVRRKLIHPRGANIELAGSPDAPDGYEFLYRGRLLENAQTVCAVSCLFPLEQLKSRGSAWMRDFALKLATKLPFDSGLAGLSFLFRIWTQDNISALRDKNLRHPGVNIPDSYLYMSIGTSVKGVSWLTFVGPSVLDALGGVDGLRARLHSPGTTVEALGPERAVVTLGTAPEAGDTETGHLLPAYRELARVLEPWLYVEQRCAWRNFTLEEVRRWERRFLD